LCRASEQKGVQDRHVREHSNRAHLEPDRLHRRELGHHGHVAVVLLLHDPVDGLPEESREQPELGQPAKPQSEKKKLKARFQVWKNSYSQGDAWRTRCFNLSNLIELVALSLN
jgi:hypothetical protein